MVGAMPERTPSQVYDEIHRLAPEFGRSVEQAAHAAHNEAEIEGT